MWRRFFVSCLATQKVNKAQKVQCIWKKCSIFKWNFCVFGFVSFSRISFVAFITDTLLSSASSREKCFISKDDNISSVLWRHYLSTGNIILSVACLSILKRNRSLWKQLFRANLAVQRIIKMQIKNNSHTIEKLLRKPEANLSFCKLRPVSGPLTTCPLCKL